MLESMRKHMKLLSAMLWIAIIAFLGTIFLVWGMGGKQETDKDIVALVNGHRIGVKSMEDTYSRLLAFYQKLYEGKLPEGKKFRELLRKTALDELIDRALLLDEVTRMGIFVSDVEVRAHIETLPAFQKNGEFDIGTYKRILNWNKIPIKNYETSVRDDLILQKLSDFIRGTAIMRR